MTSQQPPTSNRSPFNPTAGESPDHKEAKEFLCNVLNTFHINTACEEPFLDKDSNKTYYADVYAWFTNFNHKVEIDIEIDGPKGHNSEHNLSDDYNKQKALRQLGVATVRLDLDDIKKAMRSKVESGVNAMLAEILFRLVDRNEPIRGVY